MVHEAIDTLLRRAGLPIIESNDAFATFESGAGTRPGVELVKPGVAPLRFVMGLELDVWVGPYSEFLLVDPATCGLDALIELLERVLRSQIMIAPGRWSTKITAQLPGSQPWRTLRVWPRGGVQVPSQTYRPYLPNGSTMQARFE